METESSIQLSATITKCNIPSGRAGSKEMLLPAMRSSASEPCTGLWQPLSQKDHLRFPGPMHHFGEIFGLVARAAEEREQASLTAAADDCPQGHPADCEPSSIGWWKLVVAAKADAAAAG
jgi:hypothetical protein